MPNFRPLAPSSVQEPVSPRHTEHATNPREDALLQHTLDNNHQVSAYSPAVIATLSRVIGNQAVQRMVQNRPGHVSLMMDAHGAIQRGPKQAAMNVDKVAESIASGHSFTKHVVEEKQFPEVSTKAKFGKLVSDVMFWGTNRNLADGRIAYWRGDTIVIYNPNDKDLGTCFKPEQGQSYYDNLV